MLRTRLAALLTTAALAASFAGPAHADPSDGEGCVGTPTLPASYVCVISLTPTNALPTTSETYVPVDVPPLCYFLDCTDPTTVNVPVPHAALGSGAIAVLWYQGQYYPIAIGTLPTLGPTVIGPVVDLVNGVLASVPGTVQTVQDTVDDASLTVKRALLNAEETACDVVQIQFTSPLVQQYVPTSVRACLY